METPGVIRGSPALLLMLLLAADFTEAYKPVIIVHGLFNEPSHFDKLKMFITQMHPGTKVEVIDLFNNEDSLEPMWMQVVGVAKVIRNIMQKFPEGAHLICYSQGGLICQGVLSILPNHNVQNFLALSSPMAGQYGVSDTINPIFPKEGKRDVENFCYSQIGQEVSICNYWKEWKKNFLSIKKMVLIGGPNDGVITPWQSSFFGFYDSNENIIEMRNQKFYKSDAFGLRTLDARGDIYMCVLQGKMHSHWHTTVPVFRHCIERWLT
ncbi:lysosomal thioesterase PPT2-A-like [Xenentodon cancila]